jgi:hypothetical protein
VQRLVLSSGARRVVVRVGASARTVVLPLGGRPWSWLSHGTWKMTDGRLVALHVERLEVLPDRSSRAPVLPIETP